MDESYPRMYLYRRLVDAKLFIDQQYDKPIDVNNISNEAHFSKFHFIRLFKKTYGMTPHQYLIFVRIERAKELLRASLPAAVVCFDVGFESVGSFTTLFKRRVGKTPSIFRQHHIDHRLDAKERPLRYVPGCFAGNYNDMKKSNFEEAQ